jgi:hypothetical protein
MQIGSKRRRNAKTRIFYFGASRNMDILLFGLE